MTDAAESAVEGAPPASATAGSGSKPRWARIGAIALGAIALLLGALYATIVIVFPPERLATLLAEQVKRTTGRDFRIDGGLSIAVLPNIAVRAENVVLGNAEWGSQPDMLRVKHARLRVSPSALLHKELRILSVEVEGVDALLESDAAGRANWQFAPPKSTPAPAAAAASGAGTLAFALDRLVLADVRLAYRDGANAVPRTLVVESLDLQDRDGRDHVVAKFAVDRRGWQVEGDIGRIGDVLAGAADWPFDLRLATEGATLTSSGAIGIGTRVGIVNVDVVAKFTTATALMPLVASAAALPMPLEVHASLRRSASVQDWSFELRLAAQGAALTSSGTVGTGARAGTVNANLSAKLTTAAALAPLAKGAAALPMPLDVSATLRHTEGELQIESMHATLAGQTVDGRVTLHTTAPRPRLDAELSSAVIDVAKLRAGMPAAKPPAATSPKAGSAFFDDTPLPIPALPDMDLRLVLKVDRLNLPGMPPLSALQGQLNSLPGQLAIDGLEFGVAGGVVRGKMALSVGSGAPPRTELSLDAKSLSVETLSRAFGSGSFRGGRANLLANLAMSGDTPRHLAASATGEVLFSAAGSTLAGSGAAALDQNVIVTLLQLLIPKQSASGSLVVECAVARLPFRKGVAVVDRSIALETREVAVVASGKLNLADQTIRLEFRPQVKKGLGLSPTSLAQLMVLSGPLQDPHVGIDAKGAVIGAANVGVVVATGGLSLLAPAVTGRPKDEQACGKAATEAETKPAADEKKSRFRLFGR